MEWEMLLETDHGPPKQPRRISVDEHPLKAPRVERIPRKILGSLPSTGRTTPVSTPAIMFDLNAVLEGIDPLTKFAIEEMDPLSQMAAEMANSEPEPKKKDHKLSFDIEPWSSRKQKILSKYTTSEKLCIITSFLSDGEKVVVKAQGNTVDKVQHRLEQLDYFEEGSQKKFDVSQIEYVGRIEQLNKELVLAWNTNQRVKALKIAIQCAKLLSDTDVLAFYPSKFVLITDILDIFGNLVYERLHTKSDYFLPEDFASNMVPESTKETCRNWFYKIASIRELVPRIFVEMAILKSYRFLTTSEYSAALLRLTKMIRGIGNPLVAVYARCYLCRVGITVITPGNDTKYLLENFNDFLEGYKHLTSRSTLQQISKQKIDFSEYMTLYKPSLDFILQAAASGTTESLVSNLLERCKKLGNRSLLLDAIMSAFKPNYISVRALQLLEMIKECSEEGFPKYLLFKTLGSCVSDFPPPVEHRKQVLSSLWMQITCLNNSAHYIACAEAWIQISVQNLNSREMNKIIGDIIKHMTPGKSFENHYNLLKSIIEKIVSRINDFEVLFSMENFLSLVDLFQQENLRVDVCKSILGSCNIEQQTWDPVTINALMFICKILHDSVNALTVDDERRQIGELIAGVIRRVDCGRDFEEQLSFYVEARGAFANIDIILAQLVQSVNLLSIQTRRIVKGHHTRKTGAFVRACAAYCFITIPSIGLLRTQLELYLLSARVALLNNCLGQADASLKASLSIIPELCKLEERHDAFIVSYICNLLSTLLVVPDSPSSGVLNLTRILLNTLQQLKFHNQDAVVPSLYLNVVDMLGAMAQENYPYHVDKVESNDTLYGQDVKFINEINRICTIILGEIMNHLKKLGPCRKQSTLALELMMRVVTRADITSKSMSSLALNLWHLSFKHGHADVKFANWVKEYIRRKSISTNNNNMLRFVELLKEH